LLLHGPFQHNYHLSGSSTLYLPVGAGGKARSWHCQTYRQFFLVTFWTRTSLHLISNPKLLLRLESVEGGVYPIRARVINGSTINVSDFIAKKVTKERNT
jgi:hypothetical protein